MNSNESLEKEAAPDAQGENVQNEEASVDAITKDEDKRVAEGLKEAFSERFPMESENGRLRLEIDDVYVDTSNDPAKKPGFIAEKRAKGQSYELDLKGDLSLYRDGEKVNSTSLKLGPYFPPIDNLGTRLIKGRHYQSKFQLRRKPGIYPFKNQKGQSLVEFNSEQGGSFNYVVDADQTGTPTLDVQVTGRNRKTIVRGVYVLLKIFGASESEIKGAMGELYKYNRQKLDVGSDGEEGGPVDLQNGAKKFFTAIMPESLQEEIDPKEASFEVLASKLKAFLTDGQAFDPSVTEETLGDGFDSYTKASVLRAAERLVQTYNGSHKPAHRFAEKFRSVHGLGTQIREDVSLKEPRSDKKLKGQITRKVMRVGGQPSRKTVSAETA